MNPRQQLDALLRETPAEARSREQAAFDQMAGKRRNVVIFGAGRLGRKVRTGIAGSDLNIVAFSDNNRALWGSEIDGLPVLKPEEAAARHGSEATFVIAVWHPSSTPLMSQLLAQLRGLRCRAAAFPVLFWRHASAFLPYFFWDLPSNFLRQKHDLKNAFDLLEDNASRQTLVEQVQLRLRADFDCLAPTVPGAQYFPGLFSLSADECFVDCGAYTGDSLQAFISATSNAYRKMIAFEADPAVVPALENVARGVGGRAVLHKSVVGAHNGVAHFSGDGIGGGCLKGSGGIEVPCVRLDDALGRETVSFIKMDIEGAELQALEGAHRVIWRNRPVLAICGYHTPDHLWRVPVALKSLAPDASLFLRSHCADGLDTVCYAVPPERRVMALPKPSGKKRVARKRPHAQGAAS